uniref:SSD domain-containing protein n=1 Tax=Panagrolaimus sp. JU765 TaxID=591449 RepID=A0AC34QDR4_9BILA
MFVDVGPSITITFATNVLAFVVDLFSPTPEITLFCTGNAVAIFFDYVFQFTIFGPIMIIAAEYEMKTDNERMMKSLADVKSFEKRKKLGNFMEKMLKKYCRWIADGFTFGLMVLVLIVYWIVSLRGALNINPSITPEKLFLQDSLVTKMNILRDTYILPNYTAINVFVNNVGNLSSFDQQNRIKNLINDYEKHPECLGKDYTHFWFRDYEKYL